LESGAGEDGDEPGGEPTDERARSDLREAGEEEDSGVRGQESDARKGRNEKPRWAQPSPEATAGRLSAIPGEAGPYRSET
jgi:hypothetical protein